MDQNKADAVKPPRPCLTCGVPVRGAPRCPAHATGWGDRPSAAARGYGGDWSAISRRTIAEVGHCEICGTTEDLTTDHILPLSKGGTHDRANLRVLCRHCNTSRAVRASNERRRLS